MEVTVRSCLRLVLESVYVEFFAALCSTQDGRDSAESWQIAGVWCFVYVNTSFLSQLNQLEKCKPEKRRLSQTRSFQLRKNLIWELYDSIFQCNFENDWKITNLIGFNSQREAAKHSVLSFREANRQENLDVPLEQSPQKLHSFPSFAELMSLVGRNIYCFISFFSVKAVGKQKTIKSITIYKIK